MGYPDGWRRGAPAIRRLRPSGAGPTPLLFPITRAWPCSGFRRLRIYRPARAHYVSEPGDPFLPQPPAGCLIGPGATSAVRPFSVASLMYDIP